MTTNYSKGQPVGNNGVPQFNAPPPVRAVASNGNTNLAASSVISLSADTTAIEISTQGAGGAVMKWIATADTVGSVYSISSVGATFPANFDHSIPEDAVRRFVVPVEAFPTGKFYYGSPSTVAFTSQIGANTENGLFRRVAIVSAGGVSSVLVTEYANFV